MNFLNRIGIKQKVNLTVLAVAIVLLGLLAIALSSFVRRQTFENADRQMFAAINKLEQLVVMAEHGTAPGFTQADYMLLKPIFSQNIAYKTDLPFLIDNTGNILIHSTREGQRLPRELMRQFFATNQEAGSVPFSNLQGYSGQTKHIYFKKVQPYNAFVAIEFNPAEALEGTGRRVLGLIVIALIASLLLLFAVKVALNPTLVSLTHANSALSNLIKGQIPPQLPTSTKDEAGKIVLALNKHIEGLYNTIDFATEIGKNNLEVDFQPLSKDDQLGNSLLDIRMNLQTALKEEQRRKNEDEQRSWFNSGLASFSDTLRQNNNNLQQLSDHVIQNLVNYLDANQGGLFILNDDDPKEPFLELISTFAYNRRKIIKKIVYPGEGLVGNCLLEKQTQYLTEIPDDYIQITSGLGDAAPTSLLIVPLMLEDRIFGAIEIASFKEFEKHEVEFVEKVGESIAASLSTVKSTTRTNQLLEQSQQQREEMAAQEEEMRQNMEEMQATQEEMARKNNEMEAMTSALDQMLLFCEISTSGAFIRTNQNFLNITRCHKEALESKTLKDFINTRNKTAFDIAWQKALEGITFRGTLQIKDINGGEYFILCSMHLTSDDNNNTQKVFFLGQDVTESKNIEIKAIKQSEEIEQTLLELQVEHEISQEREEQLSNLLMALNNNCLVAEVDAEETIQSANERFAEVAKQPIEDIEGTTFREVAPLAKENSNEFDQIWENLMAGLTQSTEVKTSDKGQDLWLQEIYTPIKDEDEQVTRVVYIGSDITKGKEIELKLMDLISKLQQQGGGKE